MSEHDSDDDLVDKYLIDLKENEDDKDKKSDNDKKSDKDKKSELDKEEENKDPDNDDKKRTDNIFSEILEEEPIQVNDDKKDELTDILFSELLKDEHDDNKAHSFPNIQINIDINNINNTNNTNTNNTNTNNTPNQTEQDKLTLVEMGFDRILVNKIYSTVYPTNIEEALDYLQKDENDKFTHSYIPNNLSVCSICGKLRQAHAGESLFIQRERELERERQRLQERLRNSTTNNKYTFNKSNKFDYGKKECGVCSDEITAADKAKVKLPCNHYFCFDCWSEYLKEKINNANVYKISCMEHKCGYILEEKFVKSIIGSDNTLVEKYDKFLTRKKLMDSNKKIKFCPIPDCDGYAEKKKSKYVKCNFGHEFCFECGQQPHGKKKCAKVIDEGFEEWKSHTLVKRCPYCKFWTEKNEGCNHMTCSQCKYQWCWICEKECVAGHYNFGPCRGMHFESARSKELASQHIKYECGLCCIVSFLISNFIYLLIYLLMMPCFYLAVLGLEHLKHTNTVANVFFCLSFLPFFISYEVISICYITVISVPAIIIYPYFKFLRYILLGQVLGRLFPV